MAHVSNTPMARGAVKRSLPISGRIEDAFSWPIMLFMASLVLPFIIQAGGLRLSVYRMILILLTIPVLHMWITGKAGQKRVADFAVIGLCFWMFLSMLVVHGPSTAIEAGGIYFIETCGAYMVGRCFVRTADDFLKLTRILFWTVMFFAPFALLEALTGWNLILQIMDTVFPSYDRVAKNPRWGMDRVQGTFEHPILFGVYCGSAIGLAYMVLGFGKSFFRRIGLGLLVFFTAALSLSAGPLTGMIVQFELAVWNEMFSKWRGRWKFLLGITVFAYLAIELGSNRSAPAVFISYFSFNEFSAFMRIHIWNFGTKSILNNPLFGIGFNEWERHAWMSSSIDMFWIVAGVRHGIPAVIFTFLSFWAVYLPLAFKKDLSERHSAYRLGALIALTAFFLSGWTVHFWNATYVLFMFLLGSAVWVMDATDEDDFPAPRDGAADDAPTSRYSRFPQNHSRATVKPADNGSVGKVRRTLLSLVAVGLGGLLIAGQANAETVRVKDRTELEAAIATAAGGETIQLANRFYGSVSIEGRVFAQPIRIASDTNGPAEFAEIAIIGSQGIHISGVHVNSTTNGSQGSKLIHINNSSDIVVERSQINGAIDDIYNGHVGIYVDEGGSDIKLIDNVIHDVKRGAIFLGASNLLVRGNRFDRLGDDALKFSSITMAVVEKNVGARLIFPEPGAHLDFIQFQGGDSRNIIVRDNISLPGNDGAVRAQGIFFDDAHFTNVLIENNIIVTGMIRGISVSSGTNVVARNNTVLDIEGKGSKATKVMVDGTALYNIMGSYPFDKSLGPGQNLVLQQGDPSRGWHYDEFFVNADHGIGLTIDDLRPRVHNLDRQYGADVDRILN